jgi:hypothetical protein
MGCRMGRAELRLIRPSCGEECALRVRYIVGGGGAGLAAADMARREGYSGPLTMISADSAPPCDRPNLFP